MNKEAKEVLKLAKEKGFPHTHTKENSDFLLQRIQEEINEARGNWWDNEQYQEELIDVLIQTLQALAVIDSDIDTAFRKKMDENWKRNWNH